MRVKDGTPSGGRPPGALNCATRDLKRWLQGIFTSPEYRALKEKELLSGTAPPQLEIYLLQMLYGRAPQEIDLRVGHIEDELSNLSHEQLRDRAEALVDQLREADALKKAIDVIAQPAQEEIVK